jgi:hypothetical protein
MKPGLVLFSINSLFLSVLLLTGCASDYGNTSPYHPGPVAGKAMGNSVGVVAGNAAGFGVGVVEGTAHGLAAPFDPSYRMVRRWNTETTSDGRVIQVPVDVLIDRNGRAVGLPAPTGNSAGPTAPAQP